MQNVQKTFECCGLNGPTDYDNIKLNRPASCCGESFDSNPNANCTKPEKAFDKGCVNTISDIVKNALGGLGGVAIALVLIQLLIVVSACCLAREVR